MMKVLEHRPDLHHFLPMHSGHVPDTLRGGAIGARLRAVGNRQVFSSPSWRWARRHHPPDVSTAWTTQERAELESVWYARESSFLFNT